LFVIFGVYQSSGIWVSGLVGLTGCSERFAAGGGQVDRIYHFPIFDGLVERSFPHFRQFSFNHSEKLIDLLRPYTPPSLLTLASLNQLGNVDPGIVRETIAHEFGQLLLVHLRRYIVNFERRTDATIQYKLDINQTQRVQLIEIKQIEQN
jgi:hypothetical protein